MIAYTEIFDEQKARSDSELLMTTGGVKKDTNHTF